VRRILALVAVGATLLGFAASGCGSGTGDVGRPPVPGGPATPPAAGPGDAVAMLLLLEDRRLFEPTVVGRALGGSERERAAVATTLGRLADRRGEQALLLLLRDQAVPVRRAAAHALRGFESPLVVEALLLAVADEDAETAVRSLRALADASTPLERIALAMSALPEEEIWRRLVPALSLFPESARRELAEAGQRDAPVELRPAIATALLHDPAPEAVSQVRELLGHEDPFVRGLAARAMGALGTGSLDLARLEPLLADQPFPRSQALMAADRILGDGRAAPPAGWVAELLAGLEGAPGHPDVELAMCGLLRHYVFEPGVADALLAVAGGERGEAARGAAIAALLWAAEPRAFDRLGSMAASRSPSARLRSAALVGSAAWPLGSVEPLASLLDRLLDDPEPGVRAGAIRALFARGDLLGRARLVAWAQERRADQSGAVRAELYTGLVDRPWIGLDALVETAGVRLEREPDAVARRQLVAALAARGAAERLERGAIIAMLELVAEQDPSHLVRRRAAEALLGFGRPAPDARPVHALDQLGAYRELEQRTSAPRMATLVTGRGDVVVRLECPLAPKSCLSFLQLAAQGFFRDQVIGERDPGMAVRAGDPTGSGWGGPGYRLRDELTPLELDRPGVLVLERPFPDGASSRFELTLSPQPWRTGREVALGYVVAGLEVLNHLQPGDDIVDIRLDEGSAGGPVHVPNGALPGRP
jgi:cyclophilin family peptidyl-prolyl cis-trans isomerase/HEAT repeat protein